MSKAQRQFARDHVPPLLPWRSLPTEVWRALLKEGAKSFVGVSGALTDRSGQCLRPESVVAGHVADARQSGEDELVRQRGVAGDLDSEGSGAGFGRAGLDELVGEAEALALVGRDAPA